MKLTIALLVCMSIYGSTCSQVITAELSKQVHTIKSINWMTNSGDMLYFDKVLTNHDILILAESDHGHGSSYDAQCAIIRRLVETKKVKALYIESSWLNCQKIVTLLKEKGEAGIKETEKYMLSYDLKYWVTNGFWHFIANEIIKGDLNLYGFDVSGVSPLIVTELFVEAQQLDPVKKIINYEAERFKDIRWYFEDFSGFGPQSKLYYNHYVVVEQFINLVIEAYGHTKDENRVKQWKALLNYFYWFYKRTEYLKQNKLSFHTLNDKQVSEFHKVRDSLMAASFFSTYLFSKEDKVVCTMSAYHALRNSYLINEVENCCKEKDLKTMAELLQERYGDKIFSICFITGSGEYGIQYENYKWKKLRRPEKESLEYYLAGLKHPYIFLDFKNTSLKGNTFQMRGVFNRFLRSNWSENYSGVFFIKEMKPLVFDH